MHVSIDSMKLTNIAPIDAANGAVRVLTSGYGPTVLRSGISISNNEIYGEGHRRDPIKGVCGRQTHATERKRKADVIGV